MAAKRQAAAKPLRARAAVKAARPVASSSRVAYYNQSTDFTCGPSSLMMAMHALDPRIGLSRTLELQLWREATTIFMGAGHGGCGALGLALAARRRGFGAEAWMNRGGVFLADRQDSKDHLQAMRLLQKADLTEARRQHIPVHRGRADLATLRVAIQQGSVPIVLVSTHLFHGDDTPHWLVVTAITDDTVAVNDPWISRDHGQTARRQTGRRVSHQDFTRMAVYGPKKERATVLIKRGS